MKFNHTLALTDFSLERGGRFLCKNLNISLKAGETLALMGKNGVGKSSLLRAIAGLLPHLGGIEKSPDFHYLGTLEGIKPSLTLEENIKFWCDLEKMPYSNMALSYFGLNPLRDFEANLLSSGQRKRLQLTRLLAQPKALWLLDEPTNALDKEGLDLLNSLLSEHSLNGGIALVATHLPLPSLKRELTL